MKKPFLEMGHIRVCETFPLVLSEQPTECGISDRYRLRQRTYNEHYPSLSLTGYTAHLVRTHLLQGVNIFVREGITV